ncbi:MAG: hypothetical protein EXS43_06210 [Opitutus sp.]|nr:hypothetical protein [Opitutus sp.]
MESPLYPLWAFYRARFLAWVMIESSEISAVPEKKRLFVGEAERCFDLARAAFPRNQVLKIYGGENIPVFGLTPWDDRAPAWANHQRRALDQLHRIIRWWCGERQLGNGEFGGKWGDDVEMWRWWAPVLIGFDGPAFSDRQVMLARGNLSRPGMAGGYTSQLTDVEHTAEETADTLTPMQHVAGDRPEWAARTRRLLELADQVWWGPNERGQLQFKHIDFNHERLGADAGRAYDTGYHVRVMQPVLLLWQRPNGPTLGAPLTRWLRTWAEAGDEHRQRQARRHRARGVAVAFGWRRQQGARLDWPGVGRRSDGQPVFLAGTSGRGDDGRAAAGPRANRRADFS